MPQTQIQTSHLHNLLVTDLILLHSQLTADAYTLQDAINEFPDLFKAEAELLTSDQLSEKIYELINS